MALRTASPAAPSIPPAIRQPLPLSCNAAGYRLGGNGILLDHHVIRHMADLEAIHTFEGTETMRTLIVGRDLTGIGAFG